MEPFPLRQQFNTNTYHEKFFCEVAFETFCHQLRDKTAAGCFSTIHRNMKAAVIRQPEIDRSLIQVGITDAYNCETCVNSTIVTDEEVLYMDCQFSAAMEICDYDVYFTKLDVVKASNEELNYKFAKTVDQYVIMQAAVQTFDANGALTQIVDEATAELAFMEATANFIGKERAPGEKCAVVPASLRQYLRNLWTTRITAKGDDILCTGVVECVDGWKIIFVSDDQFTGVLKDGTPYDLTGSVIFACGKPMDVYIDEAGFMSGVRDKQASTPNCVNHNKIYFRNLIGTAKLWNCKSDRIAVSGDALVLAALRDLLFGEGEKKA